MGESEKDKDSCLRVPAEDWLLLKKGLFKIQKGINWGSTSGGICIGIAIAETFTYFRCLFGGQNSAFDLIIAVIFVAFAVVFFRISNKDQNRVTAQISDLFDTFESQEIKNKKMFPRDFSDSTPISQIPFNDYKS